jgi:hypothetical protein
MKNHGDDLCMFLAIVLGFIAAWVYTVKQQQAAAERAAPVEDVRR